jgi:hypothetical protein
MCLPRLSPATLVGFVITAPVPDQARRGRALSDRSLQAAMILDRTFGYVLALTPSFSGLCSATSQNTCFSRG